MPKHDEKRYRIGEVSAETEIPVYVLRQWESKVPQLNPKRDTSGRRYYTRDHINIILKLRYYIRHKKMTIQGASMALSKSLHGTGELEDRRGIIDLVDKIEDEIRGALDLLDSV